MHNKGVNANMNVYVISYGVVFLVITVISSYFLRGYMKLVYSGKKTILFPIIRPAE